MMQRHKGSKPIDFPMMTIEPMGEAIEPVPDEVVYLPGGTLVAHIPADPDLPEPMAGPIKAGRVQPYGLTARMDCMARLVARGLSGVDAYRAAYGRTGTPSQMAKWSSSVSGKARYRNAVAAYRKRLEGIGRQRQIGMRDFVLSRLVVEAHKADSAPARIRALELLGKTEAMFTDVRRTEKAIDPKALDTLKAQLEQRLRAAVSRLGSQHVLAQDVASTPMEDESTTARPHGPGTPLIASGSHPKVSILSHPNDLQIEGTPFSGKESPHSDAGGSLHREMSLDDL